MPTHIYNKDHLSIGELLSDLNRQMSTLIRQEMELARMELSPKISGTVKDTIFMAVGGVLLLSGFLFLLATIIIILTIWLSLWLSALIVSLSAIILGTIFALIGKSRIQKRDIKPSQTINSLKENTQWIMNRV